MNTPDNLKYTAEHEWVDFISETTITFGITDFAQSALGDVVFASLPKVGEKLSAGQTCGEVESTKSVSDIYAPVSGTVKEINEALTNNPELINSDPYGKGWMVKLEDVDGTNDLIDAKKYKDLTAQ